MSIAHYKNPPGDSADGNPYMKMTGPDFQNRLKPVTVPKRFLWAHPVTVSVFVGLKILMKKEEGKWSPPVEGEAVAQAKVRHWFTRVRALGKGLCQRWQNRLRLERPSRDFILEHEACMRERAESCF